MLACGMGPDASAHVIALLTVSSCIHMRAEVPSYEAASDPVLKSGVSIIECS